MTFGRFNQRLATDRAMNTEHLNPPSIISTITLRPEICAPMQELACAQ